MLDIEDNIGAVIRFIRLCRGNMNTASILRHIMENADEAMVFYGSVRKISAETNISRPTVARSINQLVKDGILIKLSTSIFKVNQTVLIPVLNLE